MRLAWPNDWKVSRDGQKTTVNRPDGINKVDLCISCGRLKSSSFGGSNNRWIGQRKTICRNKTLETPRIKHCADVAPLPPHELPSDISPLPPHELPLDVSPLPHTNCRRTSPLIPHTNCRRCLRWKNVDHGLKSTAKQRRRGNRVPTPTHTNGQQSWTNRMSCVRNSRT